MTSAFFTSHTSGVASDNDAHAGDFLVRFTSASEARPGSLLALHWQATALSYLRWIPDGGVPGIYVRRVAVISVDSAHLSLVLDFLLVPSAA